MPSPSRLESASHNIHVAIVVAEYPIALDVELALVDHDQAKTTGGDQVGFALVIEPPLLPPRHPRYRRSSIEDGHGLGVLLLLELDYKLLGMPVSVDREANGTTRYWRHVAKEPVEPSLPLARDAEHFVAQIEHVMLIAV